MSLRNHLVKEEYNINVHWNLKLVGYIYFGLVPFWNSRKEVMFEHTGKGEEDTLENGI